MTALINKIDIDERIHNMTPEELWAMSRNAQPIQINATQGEFERAEKIYELMDLTDLEYADVECLIYEPHKARLCDIKVYCHALNINFLDFIQKVML
jgi:hypothetical protein